MDYKDLKTTVEPEVLKVGQEVDIVVYFETDLGYKAAINNEYEGLIYKNEVFSFVKFGLPMTAYIKCLRPDGKIDLSLYPDDGSFVVTTSDKILKMLASGGGKLPYGDKSSPEDIKNKFQVSKKVFKKAIGVLYKQKKIEITGEGIEMIGDKQNPRC
jgi:predicted RNA-binding protein (virulence factor B family)